MRKVTVLLPIASKKSFLGHLQVSKLRIFSAQIRENCNTGSTGKPNILTDNGDEDSKIGTSVLTKRHLKCYLQVESRV
jgi:hypothetical protein